MNVLAEDFNRLPKMISNGLHSSTCVEAQERLNDEILEWLCSRTVNPERTKLPDCTENTAIWMLDLNVYKAWASKPGSVLWLQGQRMSISLSA